MYSSAVRRAMAAMIRRLSGGLPLSQQGGQRPLLVALQFVELHAEAADGRDRAELDVGNAGYADGQLQGAVRQVNEQAAMVPDAGREVPTRDEQRASELDRDARGTAALVGALQACRR